MDSNLSNVFLISCLIAFISFIGISIKMLCNNDTFPGVKQLLYSFCFVYIVTFSFFTVSYFILSLDCTGFLLIIHTNNLYFLALFGINISDFEFSFKSLGGLRILSCEQGGGNSSHPSGGNSGNFSGGSSGNTSSTSDQSLDTMIKKGSELSNLTHGINAKISRLESVNLKFEDFFEKAQHYKQIHDTANEARYVELARQEKASLISKLDSVEQDINRRSRLSEQGNILFPSSKLRDFDKITPSQSETLNISTTLANKAN